MFRHKDDRRPSLSQGPTESGSDSEGYDPTEEQTPLTKEDLRRMLRETSDDIKAYTTAALEKQIAGLKEDIEALASRTSHTEKRLTDTQAATTQHSRAIETLQERVLYLEDGLEDLNNRSRRQNIRIRGLPESIQPEAILPTVQAIFQSILPDTSEQERYIERAHRALRPPAFNLNAPRDVITKLLHFPIKERLMKAARDSPPIYQGHTLHFYQDLAPTTLKKRRDLQPLTTALMEKGWRYMWGHPFKLLVKKGDQTYTLHQVTDMQDFATHIGLSLRQPTPTADPSAENSRHSELRPRPPRQQTKPRPYTAPKGQLHMDN
ncbi:Hypothetical predicted protein [Pelobates cultripes]|uniref:Uncharacterized protein n=1 Tax=Pelobates cultripes TaxID=61616 RepID=A0AAD1SFG7_PELCU|nr:Hypothetical predicted protein [Pelobates cultripes]